MVIFTASPDAEFSTYKPEDIPYKDAKLSIYFETQEMMEETLILLKFNCPDASCDYIGNGWGDLKLHTRAVHGKLMWFVALSGCFCSLETTLIFWLFLCVLVIYALDIKRSFRMNMHSIRPTCSRCTYRQSITGMSSRSRRRRLRAVYTLCASSVGNASLVWMSTIVICGRGTRNVLYVRGMGYSFNSK